MDTDNNDNKSAIDGGRQVRFRVFLASPGDVPLERELARETIAYVRNERRFRDRIDIDIVAWDQPGAAVAMEAGLTPQEAIAQGLPKPEDCDLAVVVLWSRIGTQLPADFELKEDGTPYLSGTEWEYLNARKGYRARRKPAVWVYHRTGAPNVAVNDPDRQLKHEQWDRLERFFRGFTNPDGSLVGGINDYAAPDDFRRKFEGHLRDRLDKLLETLPALDITRAAKASTAAPRWTESPYPGLATFSPEQAPIFFGRGPEIDQLLRQFSSPEVRFVAVVGVSGSGKSSLVKAGVLPRLRAGIIGNAPWIHVCFKPGERGGNPFLALAFVLKDALGLTGRTEPEIARALQSNLKEAEAHLDALLAKRPAAGELLLFIDQFEELFTQSGLSDRRDFLAFVDSIVVYPRVRVIVTTRADFFGLAIEEPVLAKLLRRDRGTFPLDPPGIGALHEMIIRPAEAAGLELQEGLAQRLLDDAAGEGPGAMSLIAFTLSQLYDHRKASYLGIADYDAFGGVQGAVQNRAESALQGLPVAALPEVFAELVEVNEQEVATRRRARKSRLRGDVGVVADALVDARLLVTDEGEGHEPTVEVAHETVLTGWKGLRDWIRDHAGSLRARRDLERVAAEWDKSERHGSALRTGRLLQRYLHAATPRSPTAEDYLADCIRRRRWFRVGYAALALVAMAALGLFVHVSKSQYPPALAAEGLMVDMGLWPPVQPPTMQHIPDGHFEMGDANGDTDERRVHTVHFANAFEMGKYEVTFDEYDLFAAATGREKPGDQGWGRSDRPVINVSWDDAFAYTQWLSERTGLKFRLPSEAEWEYSARATTTTPQYWTEGGAAEKDPACTYANVFDAKNQKKITSTYGGITWNPFDCEDEFPFTSPVGKFEASKWGLHDMLGNVWEWTHDCYQESYKPQDRTAQESDGGEDCPLRVLRGGSWSDKPRYVRSADRSGNAPGYRGNYIGFRLARTL